MVMVRGVYPLRTLGERLATLAFRTYSCVQTSTESILLIAIICFLYSLSMRTFFLLDVDNDMAMTRRDVVPLRKEVEAAWACGSRLQAIVSCLGSMCVGYNGTNAAGLLIQAVEPMTKGSSTQCGFGCT
jgi:hypothetical protein